MKACLACGMPIRDLNYFEQDTQAYLQSEKNVYLLLKQKKVVDCRQCHQTLTVEGFEKQKGEALLYVIQREVC